METFQEFILKLVHFWTQQGCIWSQPYDSMMGAGTFHPHTFLKGLGPNPWKSVYVQPCRRPLDGRYGESTYRLQHYYQLQVILKPAPENILDIYLSSLNAVGIHLTKHDINLLEDDWKGPTLGAWGLGWEVRANGQEVTQFTYFQQLAGMDLDVICGEITYGLERLYMYAYGISNVFDIPYTRTLSYGDIYQQNEVDYSHYNFQEAPVEHLFSSFDFFEKESKRLAQKNLTLPAYDNVLNASHTFNLLDARGALSTSERQRFIARVRECARLCAISNLSKLPAEAIENTSQIVENPPHVILQAPRNPSQLGNQTDTFVVEVGVEEMPPAFQEEAYEYIEKCLQSFISRYKESCVAKGHKIDFQNDINNLSWDLIVTNRRLGVIFKKLPSFEPDTTLEISGPAKRIAAGFNGELTKAGLGFCKKNNIDTTQIYWKEIDNSEYLTATIKKLGNFLPQQFGEEFINIIKSVPCNLKMRWLAGEKEGFIRPVRWIYSQFGSHTVAINGFGVISNDYTFGHRTHSPGKIHIENANHYLDVLKRCNIHFDWKKRKESIKNQLEVGSHGLTVSPIISDDFLSKLNGMTEWPVVYFGSLNDKYLTLPIELVKSVLQEHMNCFVTTKDVNGNRTLSHYFAGVSNGLCEDNERMIRDVQNVASGRLEDGLFYYNQDLESPLTVLNDQLKLQIFQKDLGTLWDKAQRMKSLLNELKPHSKLSDAEFAITQKSCEICKADLRTGCVQEFPDEMQGVMGFYLVKHQNYGDTPDCVEQIALTLKDHYLPNTAKGPLPNTISSQLLSLIDKLDSLSALIWRGDEVKANRDPFGLRRLAIGALRLLGADEESLNIIDLPLKSIIEILKVNLEKSGLKIHKTNAFEKSISQFFITRLKVYWKEEFESSVVEAFCQYSHGFSIFKIRRLIVAANTLFNEGSLLHLVQLFRRVHAISIGHTAGNQLSPELFVEDQEVGLCNKIKTLSSSLKHNLNNGDLDAYLNNLMELHKPLSDFFEHVLVNTDDINIRKNRIALLFEVKQLFDNIGDFSALQVPKK